MTHTELRQKIERRFAPIKRGTNAGDLLKFAGTWQGNDLEECLCFVEETRSKSQFRSILY